MLNLLYKEFLSYFKTPLAYFVLLVYLGLSLTFTLFMGSYLQVGNAALASFFLFQPQVLASIIPALTMKLWADEKRSGTVELLLTQPLGYTQIIIAKFTAGFIMGLLLLIFSFLFWAYTSLHLDLDNANIVSAYLACLLTMAMFTAIGCVVSSLSKNAITAYIITTFLCWVIPYLNFDFAIAGSISPALVRIFQSLNFLKHFNDMVSGQLGFDNIVYYLSFVILALWLNKVIVETKIAAHRYKKGFSLALFVAMLAIIFIFINLTSALLLGGSKFDLTQDKRYSLSSASRRIVRTIKEPIHINVYLSSDLADSYPRLAVYSQYVLRHLSRFETISGGNLKVEIRDPQPYSEIESEALAQGIKPLLTKTGKSSVYFGAVFADARGTSKVIPSFIEDRQSYFEYDIVRILYKFTKNELPTVGILAPAKFKEQYIAGLLQHEYNAVYLSPDSLEIPINIKSLLVVNPQNISQGLTYAIDQFALRGGGVALLVDPYSEEQAGIKSILAFQDKTLYKYLANLGIDFDPDFIAGDRIFGQDRVIGNKLQKFYPWIQINKKMFATNHLVLHRVNSLVLRTPGFLTVKEPAIGLFATSHQAGIIPVGAAALGPQGLIDFFADTDKSLTLAAVIEGKITSMFDGNIIKNKHAAELMMPYISVSIHPAHIVVVADSDFIYDDAWVQPPASDGNDIYGAVYLNNNGEFLIRIMDYLNNDLDLALVASHSKSTVQDTIEDNIDKAIYARYYADYDRAMQKLLNIENEVNRLNDELENKNEKLNVASMKALRDMEDEHTAAAREVQHFDYQMLQDRNFQINLLIVSALVIIPLLSLVLLLVIGLGLYFINKRKALELINEQH